MLSKFILRIIGFIICLGVLFGVHSCNMGNLYVEYRELSEYRRLHPDFLPNENIIRLIDGGHTMTYADMLWINLIQYIWDNIGGGKFRNYANPLITSITDLSPYFNSPYNLAQLITPVLNAEKPTYEEDRKYSQSALEIGKKWMQILCDQKKIEQILQEDASKKLWDNESLKDPCTNGILPYHIAYTANELWDIDTAEKYYKIASMHHDGPLASRFLGTLARANEGDHLISAEKFLLIAIEWYDEAPYICRNTGVEIFESIRKNTPLKEITDGLRNKEAKLVPPKDTKNPLATSGTNCNDSVIRAMKQLYIAYITEVARDHPDIDIWSGLIKAGLLKSIPSTFSQDGWVIYRSKENIWKYRPRTPKDGKD